MNAVTQFMPLTPARKGRKFTEELEMDFRTDNGELGLLAVFEFDVEIEEEDRACGVQGGFDVTGEIASIKIGGLTVRRNFNDEYNCDLVSIISENHEAALSDLTEMEEVLASQITDEFDAGDRTL